MTKEIKADILIIGGGLAGLTAALAASSAGLSVALATKSSLLSTSGNSSRAGGGFAACTGTSENGDSPWSHYEDTLKSGGYINSRGMVKVMSERASGQLQTTVGSRCAVHL